MPNQIDLAALFNLPPAEAIAAFEAKGFKLSWDWHDTWREANAKAFTVAKLMRMDVLQDINGATRKTLSDGQTEAWFARRLTPVLQDKGWWGKKIVVGADGQAEVVQEGSPRRLKTIFRTNLQTAYAAGRWKQFQENADDRPYLQYVAVMDGRTRAAHLALNGKVFPIDSPTWKVIAPPNGFNCRCRVRALSKQDLIDRELTVAKDVRVVERQAGQVLADKRTGEFDPAKQGQRGVSVPDDNRTGKRVTLWADSGWDYNPGEAWQKPFTPPLLDSLPKTFFPGQVLPDLPAPSRVLASRLLDTGLPPETYARTFLAEFGADVGKPVVFMDVKNEPLVISEALFQDGFGAWKSDKNGRGPYMTLLADAVRFPDEIWLRWEESRASPGTWLLKRRYIKTFEIDGGGNTEAQYGLAIFEQGKDGWAGSSVMVPQPERSVEARKRYIEKQRDGFLLYRK